MMIFCTTIEISILKKLKETNQSMQLCQQTACYCDACLDCQCDLCGNLAHVDDWEEQALE